MTDWKSLLGKRVLIQKWFSFFRIDEAVVKKVSPSGNLVKFQWQTGVNHWEKSDTYSLIEVLDE